MKESIWVTGLGKSGDMIIWSLKIFYLTKERITLKEIYLLGAIQMYFEDPCRGPSLCFFGYSHTKVFWAQ